MLVLGADVLFADNLEFHVYRDNYKSFETVQIEVSINNITLTKDLSASNLVLLDSNNNSISIAKTIVKVNDNLYAFYFDLPSLEAGSYKIGFDNVFYIKDNAAKVDDFFADLNVVSRDMQILSIRPGYVFIRAKEEPSFTLTFYNKGKDSINIVLEKEEDFLSLQKNELSLAPSESKSIGVFTSFSDTDRLQGKIVVRYVDSSYEIPVFIERLGFVKPIIEKKDSVVQEVDLKNVRDAIYLSTLSGRALHDLNIDLDVREYSAAGQVVVNNNAGVDLHGIKLYLSGDIVGMLDIQPDSSDVMFVNSTAIFTVSVNNGYKFSNGKFMGSFIVGSSENASLSIPVVVNVVGVEELVQNKTVTNKTAVNETVVTPVQEGKTNFGWIILFFVIFILLIALFLIYKKTKLKKAEFEAYIERIKQR